MKKFFIGVLCAAMLFAFSACNDAGQAQSPSGYNPSGNRAENTGVLPSYGENTAVNDNVSALLSADLLLQVTPQNMLSCNGYDARKFSLPFYKSQIQYNEGFFLLEDESGNIPDVTAAFEIAKVLEVRSNDLSVLYEEGRDYYLNDKGGLSFPDGSRISAVKQSEFFLSSGSWYEGGRPVVNQASVMYKGHYVVTYIRTQAYEGERAECAYDALTHFKEKAEAKQDIELLVVGDSIAAGAGVKDFDNWVKQVSLGVEYYTESKVTLYNTAVPGIHSGEYVNLISGNPAGVAATIREDATAKFAVTEERKTSADLVIVAVGANDAGGWCGENGTSVENYKSNVGRIVDYFREANPDCSILLVSCMQTNPKITDASGSKLAAASFLAYENALAGIAESETNIAVAKVYGVESGLLNRKNIEDMLGDNINHPSDYMSRVYAQVVLDTLLGI